MSIEDVQFLLENSVHESSLYFVDSSTRNRAFYPTPSEYVVNFDEPLKYVFGMDVLDATIPSTMYNVDVNNNFLGIVIIDTARSAALAAFRSMSPAQRELRERAVITDEYAAMGYDPIIRSWAASRDGDRSVIVMSDSTFRSHLPAASAVVDAPDSNGVYHSVLIKHVIAGVPLLLIDESTVAAGCIAFKGTRYQVLPAGGEAGPNASLARWIDSPDCPRASVSLFPTSADLRHASVFDGADSTAATLFDIVYYRSVTITPDQYSHYTSTLTASEVLFAYRFLNIFFETGNYTITTLLSHVQTRMSPYGIAVSSTSSASVDRQGRMRYQTDSNTRLLIRSTASSACALLGFDTYANKDQNDSTSRSHNAVPFGADDNPFFMSVLGADGVINNRLDSPGIVNLLGVRYVTLRCKEIEEHIGSIGKYSARSTGIGVFKLSNVNEVTNLRFDFVSLIRKPFHPIGRLSRMSMRFEMNDGQLYDFKGINHQLLITIKYYVPALSARARILGAGSVLNPEYDPDFVSYTIRHTQDAANALADIDEEDEEQGDDELDADERRRIMLEHYKNEFLENEEYI